MLESEHTSGVWDWDDVNKQLFFTSNKLVEDTGAGAVQQVKRQVPGCTHAQLELTFNAAPDVAAFRRSCRRDRTLGADVVTLRDIKDVVLFSVTTPLPLKLIDLLHTVQADRLLRAVIVYMQLYLQMSAEVSAREELVTRAGAVVMREGDFPPTIKTEARMLADLAVLRSVVGCEYCGLLLGVGELGRYHHMANQLHKTMPEDDMRIHELFHQLAAQVAWVALGRRAQTQPMVCAELGRLLRSAAFNVAEHRTPSPPMSHIKQVVLFGPPDPYGARRKLLVRSVTTLDLLALTDYEVAGIGYLDVPHPSVRGRLLEAELLAPEETLASHNAYVGVLGHPLADFDDMINLIKFTDDSAAPTATSTPALVKFRSFEQRRSVTEESLAGKVTIHDSSSTGSKGRIGFGEKRSFTEAEGIQPNEEWGDMAEDNRSGIGEKESVLTAQSALRTVSIDTRASSTSRRAMSAALESRAQLAIKKSREMAVEVKPIPPPDYFPARASGLPRGSPDLLEARAIWRRFNRNKAA